MKIYTKTGDKGQTSLFGGKRVSKASLRIEAVGAVDELNSAIGVALAQIQNSTLRLPSTELPSKARLAEGGRTSRSGQELKNELEKIQHDLFIIGSVLASSTMNNEPSTMDYLKSRVTDFEQLIDVLTSKLLPLTSFILPGGSKAGAALHLARAVSRRAERRVVALAKKEEVPSEIVIYLNRLSDLLFTLARFVNYKDKHKEIIWRTKYSTT